MIEIPGGKAILGTDFHKINYGWDNEFPECVVDVPSFKIDKLPVTIGEFRKFVDTNEYNNSAHWTPQNWEWKQNVALHHPHSWLLKDNAWFARTVFGDLLPLDTVEDWPVYVSQAEASAYAKWVGKRLPTEGGKYYTYQSDCIGDIMVIL
jgi:formylglycine-generating enzyme required for sulfatase activity